VLDVPPKLAARVRLLETGDVNKNDPNDARSVKVAALRSKGVTTKTKMIKRQMYGRAGLTLLRHRILPGYHHPTSPPKCGRAVRETDPLMHARQAVSTGRADGVTGHDP
jgi:hypothetical protein